jgi:hypothetical protein
MDFAKLDLRGAAGSEDWLHLRIGEQYLYLDDEAQTGPCRVKVASVADASVERALTIAERAGHSAAMLRHDYSRANRQQKAEIEGKLDAAEKAATKAVADLLITAIRDWENIYVDGKPLEFSKDALADLCQPKAPFFRMSGEIMEDMAKLASPFGKPATD